MRIRIEHDYSLSPGSKRDIHSRIHAGAEPAILFKG